MDDVAVTAAHDTGVKLLGGSLLRGGSIAWSGRYGLSAHGASVTVDGVDVSHSDAAHYRDSTTGGCVAAGGSKFVKTVGLVLRNSVFHDNLCNGIWLDVDTYDSTVENNTSVRNEKDGIRVEVSHKMAISGNTVADNGGWGIYLSNAPEADVYGNTVDERRQRRDRAQLERADDPGVDARVIRDVRHERPRQHDDPDRARPDRRDLRLDRHRLRLLGGGRQPLPRQPLPVARHAARGGSTSTAR